MFPKQRLAETAFLAVAGGDGCGTAGQSEEAYGEVLESLRKMSDLLDRLRAEPPSPKRDAAIERISSVMVSALSVVRDLGGQSMTPN
jgi:hypothetical protein